MSNILVTGATGNIGFEVVRELSKLDSGHHIFAAVRAINKAKNKFNDFTNLDYRRFDFEDSSTFDAALDQIDIVFLLRPPHISDIECYFKPLISKIKEKGIKQVVFLSVQGAEKSKVIPHNKIERLIQEFGLDYIFIRPSYFMQNLTTTLLKDIRTKREIILPAGHAKFNWIDLKNIGEVATIFLDKFENFKNQAIEITGLENENFEYVTKLINSLINRPISYRNVNPFKFYQIKKREGMVGGMIIVMILLHFLPRFQKAPQISNCYERLTGKKPTDLKSFIQRERAFFEL
ncbi:NAD(P)H-binding protein [Tamlana haliotis]|uniref:NAD(P)H-binding protein n=1 Tax=Pseudotamlana haliotis TaxID=2614804 RepID=A0A6N6ME50_9FLAO|nr:NmrA family NAD(P)-binding protein [Tamlana haliotis]KAB1067616.1 NAD(P)H-binding protein [Tamlana haliotis]